MHGARSVIHHCRHNRYLSGRGNTGNPVFPLLNRLSGARRRDTENPFGLLSELLRDVMNQAVLLRPVYGNPTQGTNNIAQWIPEYGVLDQEGGLIPVAQIKAMVRKKSMFELCGTRATMALSRLGNSPSIRQPITRKIALPMRRVRKLPPFGNLSPSTCHFMSLPLFAHCNRARALRQPP